MDGTGGGSFTSSLTGLQPYIIRIMLRPTSQCQRHCYVIITFQTLGAPPPTPVDVDPA
ncbi:MAG: hypothetical protein IPI88_15045 [Chitinophagaceae bacterium]|nr:hypothetical protein [Chitinophagaceae bacterium]